MLLRKKKPTLLWHFSKQIKQSNTNNDINNNVNKCIGLEDYLKITQPIKTICFRF